VRKYTTKSKEKSKPQSLSTRCLPCSYVSQSWATLGVTVLVALIASDRLARSLNHKVWRGEAIQVVSGMGWSDVEEQQKITDLEYELGNQIFFNYFMNP